MERGGHGGKKPFYYRLSRKKKKGKLHPFPKRGGKKSLLVDKKKGTWVRRGGADRAAEGKSA